jgi:hypothetical protein
VVGGCSMSVVGGYGGYGTAADTHGRSVMGGAKNSGK